MSNKDIMRVSPRFRCSLDNLIKRSQLRVGRKNNDVGYVKLTEIISPVLDNITSIDMVKQKKKKRGFFSLK